MFWKKNKNDDLHKTNLNSDEYERLFKRILEVSAAVTDCNNQLKVLSTNLDNLRGNFNRKLAGIAKEEQAEEKKIIESFNNSVELPFG
jgi:hypothetical protein